MSNSLKQLRVSCLGGAFGLPWVRKFTLSFSDPSLVMQGIFNPARTQPSEYVIVSSFIQNLKDIWQSSQFRVGGSTRLYIILTKLKL